MNPDRAVAASTIDAELFPPEFLRFLATIPERVRRLAAGTAFGSRAARATGGPFLLRGHRAYRPGDDLRRVDWGVLARHDRVVVREFDAEKDARTEVLVDASASMGALGGRVAAVRAAAIAFAVGLVDGGRARLVEWTDSGPVVRSEGDAARDLTGALVALSAYAPQGRVDVGEAMRVTAASLPRGSRVVCVSDLLTPADPSVLHRLGARARGGVLLHLRVPQVWAPTPGKVHLALDAETGERRLVRVTPALAARVAARAGEHAHRWALRARESRFACVPFAPDTAPDALLRALARDVP